MADMTKEELKEEFKKLEKRIYVFGKAREELEKESPKIADLLRAADKDLISTIIAAGLMNVVSSFFKVDPCAIEIKP